MMMMMMMMNKGEHWEKADLHSVVTMAYPAELDDSTTNVVSMRTSRPKWQTWQKRDLTGLYTDYSNLTGCLSEH